MSNSYLIEKGFCSVYNCRSRYRKMKNRMQLLSGLCLGKELTRLEKEGLGYDIHDNRES